MYNILIVDDEPLICRGLSSLLASSGLSIQTIFTAHNGYEALDYLRMEEIDLLITDIQMGSMNGIELMHQAKMAKPWVQTIIISAHETFQYAQMALRLGAKDYMIKPLNSELFLDSVRNVLLRMNKNLPAPDQAEFLSNLREHFRMQEPDQSHTAVLCEWVSGAAPLPDNPEAAASLLGLRLSGPYFTVIRINLDFDALPGGKDMSERDLTLLKYAVLNIIHELLDTEWDHYVFYSGPQEATILIQWSEENYGDGGIGKINQLDMIGRSLYFNIDKYLRIPSVIGISQVLKGLPFLPVLNGQAGKAIKWNQEHRDHFVFYYGDIKWDMYEAQEPTEEELTAQTNLIVEKAVAYIEQNYTQKGLTLQEVAQKNHVSPNYLSYLFKKNTGYNLWEYVIKLRMEKSKKLLLQTDMRRYEIADQVGYESPEHFSKIFKKYFGVSPSDLKK